MVAISIWMFINPNYNDTYLMKLWWALACTSRLYFNNSWLHRSSLPPLVRLVQLALYHPAYAINLTDRCSNIENSEVSWWGTWMEKESSAGFFYSICFTNPMIMIESVIFLLIFISVVMYLFIFLFFLNCHAYCVMIWVIRRVSQYWWILTNVISWFEVEVVNMTSFNVCCLVHQ